MWRKKLQEEENNFLYMEIPKLQMAAATFRCRTTVNWNLMSDSLINGKLLSRFKVGLRKCIVENRWTTDGNSAARRDGGVENG